MYYTSNKQAGTYTNLYDVISQKTLPFIFISDFNIFVGEVKHHAKKAYGGVDV
jgi:hypothetical protein